ncbi:MAG: DNA adenine methylase [Chloroflexi bacterium]|nr:MAG: DNA adenine methylase [Chloroflexota bacterium]
MSSAINRPLLRYAGGKFFAYHRFIKRYIPPHTIYLEPFGGGGAVLLCKEPAYLDIYNDLDYKLVNLFRVLQNPSEATLLMHRLHYTLYSSAELQRATEIVNQASDSTDHVMLAWAVLVKSWFGFNTNAIHENNVQFKSNSASDKTMQRIYKYPREFLRIKNMLPAVIERLRNVEVRNEDALDLITKFAMHDNALMYLDPPYIPETLTDTYYSMHEAYDHDYHIALADVLNSAKALVLLSGYSNDLYFNLFEQRGWKRVDYKVHTMNRNERTESLWINQAAWQALERNKPTQLRLLDLD